MKYLLTLLLIVLLTTISFGSPMVEYHWTAPDSTQGIPDFGIPPQPTPPGSIMSYEIFKATPTDTILYSTVSAPADLDELIYASVAFDLWTPTSVRVRAIDVWERHGLFSEWTEPFTVEPGPPGAPTMLEPIRVYFEE